MIPWSRPGENRSFDESAWSKLNQKIPDVDAAENFAKESLELVPYCHCVRDILIAQIREARMKAAVLSHC